MPFVAAPTLETAKLRLRAHRSGDLGDCAAMWGNPVVTHHISPRPFTREEVWARLLRYVGHWALLGYGFWLIEDKATGRFVGEVGIAEFKREMDPPLTAPEAGWVLAPWAQGRGLATEAVKAAVDWAESAMAFQRIVCIIDRSNFASHAVAAKCGFSKVDEAVRAGQLVDVYERCGGPFG